MPRKVWPKYRNDEQPWIDEQADKCRTKLQFGSETGALRGVVGHTAYRCKFCSKWHRSRKQGESK
jgi:hypothetical protein